VKNKYLFIIGFLSIALIAALFLVVRTTTTYQRAAGSSSGSTVLENSYLFASPLQAKADGKENQRHHSKQLSRRKAVPKRCHAGRGGLRSHYRAAKG
jgi:hypothetical protein